MVFVRSVALALALSLLSGAGAVASAADPRVAASAGASESEAGAFGTLPGAESGAFAERSGSTIEFVGSVNAIGDRSQWLDRAGSRGSEAESRHGGGTLGTIPRAGLRLIGHAEVAPPVALPSARRFHVRFEHFLFQANAPPRSSR